MDDRFVVVGVMQFIVIAIPHTVQVMGDCLKLIKMHLGYAAGCVEIAIFLMCDGDSAFGALLIPGLL